MSPSVAQRHDSCLRAGSGRRDCRVAPPPISSPSYRSITPGNWQIYNFECLLPGAFWYHRQAAQRSPSRFLLWQMKGLSPTLSESLACLVEPHQCESALT